MAPSGSAEDGLSLRIGARIDEFEITGRIGEGGFSIVYSARDHSLERTVALKEYLPASLAARAGTIQVQARSQRHRETFAAGLKSFINEAKLLAHFDHPSLVKVYRFWEANGTAYMVMPFYKGMTVKDAIQALPGPPDEAWLMALLTPLTDALTVIHGEQCYHRDVAPDNVLLLADSGKPLLLDFGAARRVVGDMTQALTVILKAGYAPVEQYAEVPGMKQGPWTDVYALAAVVCWAITGSAPPASIGRMVSDSFVPLAERAAGRYSDRFLRAIDRALAVLPEQRTQTMDAFRQELGLVAADQTNVAQPTPWTDPEATVIVGRTDTLLRSTTAQAAHTSPDHRKLALAAFALAAATGVTGIWWLLQRPSAEASPAAPVTAPVNAAAPPSAQTPPVPTPAATESAPDSPSPVEPEAPKLPPASQATTPSTRPPQRAAQIKPEREQAPPAQSEECNRIMQRLSLGEGSPELIERLKVLKCR